MLKNKQLVSVLFVVAVFALVAVGMKSPVMGTNFEKLTEEEATRRWETSGHGNSESEAFRHWDDEEDPSATVSTSCAKCHSTDGFEDWAADGSVDAAPLATDDIGIECTVCHTNPSTGALRGISGVEFPSGQWIDNLGNEAICMQCHQGRESTVTINNDVASAAANGVTDPDTVSSRFRFRNVHYAAAGATNMGNLAMGGYQYDGKDYDARFAHVEGYNACSTCHDPHTLEVRLDNCATCHTDPLNDSYWGGIDDPKNIRYLASCIDYDGDGNKTEGIYYEIQTLEHILYSTIQQYAKDVIGTPIAYSADSYPYFFKDTNGNGVVDTDEADRTNGYSTFTARLAKAAYNYQFVLKDHGGYAHGGKYMIQLMYDSIEDLSTALPGPNLMDDMSRGALSSQGKAPAQIDPRINSAAGGLAGLHREDEGHFNGSSGTWSGHARSSCAKCHTATGLPDFLDDGIIEDTHTDTNGLYCTTCHTSPPAMRSVPSVIAPNGAVLNMGDSSNLCLNCHTGRRGMADVEAELEDNPPWSPPSIHYYPAGAILYGTEVKGGYEYPGKTYMGLNPFPNHNGRFNTCVQCHMGTVGLCDDCKDEPCNHNVQTPNPADCVGCHGYDISQPNPGINPDNFDFSAIRPGSIPDFDADGNMSESIEDEILGLQATVVTQMGIAMGSPVIYYHGYFYNDLNNNGILDDNESGRSNRATYNTPALLKAAYNMSLTYAEPHAYIHNPFYYAQLLVDAIEDLGGNIAPYTWR